MRQEDNERHLRIRQDDEVIVGSYPSCLVSSYLSSSMAPLSGTQTHKEQSKNVNSLFNGESITHHFQSQWAIYLDKQNLYSAMLYFLCESMIAGFDYLVENLCGICCVS